MRSLIFNLLIWFAAAWCLYPLVLFQLELGHIQYSLLRSLAGIALLIIMFGKSAIDIFFLKFDRSALKTKEIATNITLTYVFIIVSVVSIAVSSLMLLLASQKPTSSPELF